MVDLSKFDTVKGSEEGAWLEVLSPDGAEEIGAKIKLAGRDSKIMKKQQKLIAKKKQRKGFSAVEEEDATIDMLVACTLDWEGFGEGKKPLEFSADEVKNLYTRYPWIMEQVALFISERSNFLGNTPLP